ncbi:flagellar biosynthesis protein FlhB [Gilvimarinus sp. SDUM040013]|uniref:Flagellar biosynthetic protein FlhB n=1 Tax=Gilvimarinus gilvus TaxID=3058038 RepID=A0ABU4RVX4_9GAMM|nr:flagellar biosynthesis protein FlhB [Gilvimarinus sp. SDUM040013]MDO3385046.1 flagellar biosynthesis protein FlhB [Gilvimarinus sp. SDUM040013]MDX6848421.1 flagellar biosynthesis protein FlhB [Gilvimarinus sp. SDUM040013]
MAEDNDSSQEKTEEPSARKLEKAREDGQIPRSRDLTTTFILLAGALGLYVFGFFISSRIVALTNRNLTLSRAEVFDTNAMIIHLASSFYEGLLAIAPFLGVLLIASIVGPIALGGWMLSAKAMAPKFNRMNPLAGLKRMFSVKALVELAKSIGKVAVVMAVAIVALMIWQQDMMQLAALETNVAIVESLLISGFTTIAMAAVTILIAAIDVPFQIWDHSKKLKMSRQELKDEHKDTEGKPEVKGRIRQLQREIAQRRMMSQVPDADVVITNPTHFAVALKYDPATMATPVLLAKGGDQVAFRIREIAKNNKIDIVESPVLARAIFHSSEVDEEIPAGLYMAVAQVLAYVFGLRNYRRGKGEKPAFPRDLNVPRDMRYD